MGTASRGGECLPATRKLHNTARSLTERYMAQRHRAEYLKIRAEVRVAFAGSSPGTHSSRSFTILRRRYRLEWARAWTRALQMVQEEAGYRDGRANNGTYFKPRPEYEVPCSKCDAPRGRPCRQQTGRVALPAHKVRFTAADVTYPTRVRTQQA